MKRAILMLAIIDLLAIGVVLFLRFENEGALFLRFTSFGGVYFIPLNVLVGVLTLAVGILAMAAAAQQQQWRWFVGLLLVTLIGQFGYGGVPIPTPNTAALVSFRWGLPLVIPLAALIYSRWVGQDGTPRLKVAILIIAICALVVVGDALLVEAQLPGISEGFALFTLAYLLAMTAGILAIVDAARSRHHGWVSGFALLTVLGVLSPPVLVGAAFALAFNDAGDPVVARVAGGIALVALFEPLLLPLLGLLYLLVHRPWKPKLPEPSAGVS